jgi:MFS family permease
MGQTSPPGPATQGPLPGARAALVLLLLINLFNYIDRQVLAAVEPNIRDVFFARDDPNAKFWMGWLGSAFMLSYLLFSPVFGYLADRTSRWLLVAIGVTVWSLASGASGLAGTFALLLLTRCFVGVGEAVYGPTAPSVISDLYPVKDRGRVLAWFYAAIPFGSALGYTLGGQMAGAGGPGWRWAFYVVVPPGLLLAALCFLMREPPRGQVDRATAARPPGLKWADYRSLLQTPSYVLCTLGMTAMTFALGGIAYWISAYLDHRAAPGLGPLDARTLFGAMTALTGLVATLLGGIAGDRLKPRFGGSYFLVSGTAMLTGVPFIFLFLYTPFPWAWGCLALAVFCLFFNTGPTNAVLANVTHPSIRASAFALNILVIHLLGDVISPPILGALIGAENRYELAFGLVSVMVLLGGVIWLCGARYLAADTARAPTRLAPETPPTNSTTV